jgi:hypothetical protein
MALPSFYQPAMQTDVWPGGPFRFRKPPEIPLRSMPPPFYSTNKNPTCSGQWQPLAWNLGGESGASLIHQRIPPTPATVSKMWVPIQAPQWPCGSLAKI